MRLFAAASRLTPPKRHRRRPCAAPGGQGTSCATRQPHINYTNICYFRCLFCAFSKVRRTRTCAARLTISRGKELSRLAVERGSAAYRGLPAGAAAIPTNRRDLHRDLPSITAAVPGNAHPAFSPLEVTQGAATLRRRCPFLAHAEAGGLALPVNRCRDPRRRGARHHLPHKSNGAMGSTAARRARARLRTTSTIMYGHVDTSSPGRAICWRCATCRSRRGSSPIRALPFVHMEAPMNRQGRARRGLKGTFREAVSMHCRAAGAASCDHQHPDLVGHMGPAGAAICLDARPPTILAVPCMIRGSSRGAAGTHTARNFLPNAMEP